MFGLETLDVLIGLVTVYLVFGLACSALVEAITAWFKVRSNMLETAVGEFLDGELKDGTAFKQAFFDHPMVQALSRGKDGRPSYIPPEVVSRVVQSLLTANDTMTAMRDAVRDLPGTPDSNRVKGMLSALVMLADNEKAQFRQAVETHFNATMDRASGWFKRHTQKVALAVSALLVIGANVDTLELFAALASNPAARLRGVEIAKLQLENAEGRQQQIAARDSGQGNALAEAKAQVQQARAILDQAGTDLAAAGLRFGWTTPPAWGWGLVTKALGLLISIFAVSLGAPFWFDLLQRFTQVRAAGIAPRAGATAPPR